jgi:adenylate cyclase
MMKIAKGTFDSDTESDPMKIFTLREFREMSDSMAQMRMGLRNFEKYVPGDVVREMLRKNAGVELGVQPRFLTIMFLDIANFTTITEDMEPLQLVKLMSSFFTEMSQAVMQTGGTVDKFIGDCIMAFWNAPSEVASHEMRAVDATIDMMRRIQNMNKENPKLPLGIRIGVHTSQCLIGNVGSPARINYTALGDGVNLASRLEGINKRFGTTVCIGNTTYEAIGEVYLCRWLDYVSVKGKEEALDVYEVISRQENASEETKEWCALYNSMKNKLHERDYESVRRTCQAILETAPNRLQVRNDKPAELLLQRLNVESPSYNLVLLEK